MKLYMTIIRASANDMPLHVGMSLDRAICIARSASIDPDYAAKNHPFNIDLGSWRVEVWSIQDGLMKDCLYSFECEGASECGS